MSVHVRYFAQQQVGTKLGGWAMNFWNLGTDVPTVGAGPAAQLAQLLEACLGREAYIPSYTCSLVGQGRVTQAFVTGFQPNTPPTAATSAYPTLDIQLILTASNSGGSYLTRQWIRGIPASQMGPAGVLKLVGVFINNVNALLAYLKSSGWAVNVLARPQPTQVQVSFNQTTGVITTSGTMAWTPNTQYIVRVKGNGVRNPLNGIWRCTGLSGTTLQINNWSAPLTPIIATGRNPTVTQQIYTQVAIAEATLGRMSNHKTGRPTNLLSGRSRRRATQAL